MSDPVEADVPRAGLFRRLAAMFYDGLLLVAVLMGITGAVIAAHGGPIDYHHFLYRGLLVVVTFMYFGGFWVHGGQTLGLRTWHLQLAIFWIATAFVGGGLLLGSALGEN